MQEEKRKEEKINQFVSFHASLKTTGCQVFVMCDFSLAEWNEISGKCFSYTPPGLGMGLGHVTCKGGQLFFVDRHCLTFPPTHPRVF